MKINSINCSKIKETRTCYNYRKIGHILTNYQQKKSVKIKDKTEKGDLKKKLKSTLKQELTAIARKTNK